MKKQVLNIFKFLLFLGIGLTIFYLVYQKQNTAFQEDCALKNIPLSDCSLARKVITDFSRINFWWILAVVGGFTVSNISRAIRWNMLLRPLGYQPRMINAFGTILIGYFANLGLPRMGEVVRAGLMSRYERIPAEKVFGTIVVDRAIDVISIFVFTGLAILLQFEVIWNFIEENVNLSERFGGKGHLLTVLGIVFAIVAGGTYLFRKSLKRTAFFRKIVTIATGFWQGIKSVGQVDRPWLFILHSVNIWLMYFAMTYLLFQAFPPTAGLSILTVLVVFVFGAWGVVIPSPGGMGTYHFLAQLALSIYGVSGNDGFSWANISFFSVQLGSNVLGGLVFLLLLPAINKNYAGAPIPPTATPAV